MRGDGKAPLGIMVRRGVFHLRRRVPKRYRAVEPRSYVTMSLGTIHEPSAIRRAPQVWSGLIEAWESRLCKRHGRGRADAANLDQLAFDLPRGATLAGCSHNAAMVHALAQGLRELFDMVEVVPGAAANSLLPIIEALIARAGDLKDDMEALEQGLRA
ncbi:hypothetical protein LAZ40_13220 [Cereibacter sphaeroides]|uniref:DUF6538 domain-containing protein n=1 Tax=Cereibacter sphaeroides TaxID=1063 RepID=UPI001F37B13B|nr:DUF6538 domain-containing protein [Cereibacter sphaeroides]MCE6959982.1 hypothetical protein [Cereibacter sphaeroides]MCE6973067.1 hypothetical protein [Cereibacter sphaeroides]